VAGVVITWWFIAHDPVLSVVYASSSQTVREALVPMDSNWYIKLGIDWHQGSVPPEDAWITRIWPPGMPFVYFLLEALPWPVIIEISVVMVLVWSTAGAVVAAMVAASGRLPLAIASVVLWIASPMTLHWVWADGLPHSDGMGAALLVLFVACVAAMERRVRRGHGRPGPVLLGAIAGALLAGSLHFRFAYVGGLAGVLVVAAVLAIVLRSRGMAKPLLALVAACVILVTPYTVYATFVLHPTSPTWSQNDYLWAQAWMTDDDLAAVGGQFLVDSGANWPCHLDPVECGRQRPTALLMQQDSFNDLRDAALLTGARHPLAFAANRLGFWRAAWFSTPAGQTGAFDAIPFGLLMIGVLGWGIWLAIRRWRVAPALISVVTILLLGQVAILTIEHIEQRYLIPILAVIWTATVLLASAEPRPARAVRPPG
jgi:hypothetical protein